MNIDASVGTLFENLRDKLELQWLGSKLGESRVIQNPKAESTGTALVGHLNLIHSNQVQVLGITEIHYLDRLSENSRRDLIDQLFDGTTDLIVIGDQQSVPDDIKQRSEASSTPLFVSSQNTVQLVSYLQYYLTSLFAEK
ncbi:MAG TPA: HPr kinase/phosphorylase, partial [Gammaproteobacteria bacterium]|nr:HPr kinase/phosphorylase [Gammaproteobacteria bacterium]